MYFKILGPLEVRDGDRLLALGGVRQRALLALLLLHANEVLSSDRLIAELWGQERLHNSSKALQVTVSRLRRTLGQNAPSAGGNGLLVTRPPGYELRLQRGQLDLHRFEDEAVKGREALAAGHAVLAADKLKGALALWRGSPLADLTYEPFSQAEIGRLEELRGGVLEDRIAADLELGRHADLVPELEALVQSHPLRERLRGELILALYRSGRQAEALEAYRETRRTLVDELGIEPGRELKELERGILAQDPALDVPERAQAEAATRGPSGSDGLVGREAEMAELLPRLDGACAGSGALILVGGEPGIGKSRLAEALAASAQERGGRVLVGRCWEAGGAPPYWPWVQALRSYLRESTPAAVRSHVGRGGAELATILPELRELIPDLPVARTSDSEGARFRLFESVDSFLRSAASSEPLALFLDDLHAADAPSLLLLRFVAGQLADAPILVVGCYRATEVGPELAEALAELSREAAVHRLALKGLGSSGTARLLELTMGQPPADDLATRVHAETRGNPLFAAEIGRLLASEGWREHGAGATGRLPIPEGVREAIGRRLGRQSDECQSVLALASVLGREFGLDTLQRIGGITEDELFAALEEATAARLVDSVPGASGRLRFSHILIRDVLYEDLPPTRRLRLHREAGEALEDLNARNLDRHLAELAHHYLEAGPGAAEKAIEYTARAGDAAASQHGYEEAARHYASALHLFETTGSGEPNTTCELSLSLGDALSRAGNELEAKDAFRRAAAIAEKAGVSDQLTRAALGYGGRFAWARAGTDPALVPLLERALAAVGEQDSPARVRLLGRLAAAMRDEPGRDRRVGLAQEALAIARRIGDPVILAYAVEGHWVAIEGPDDAGNGIAVGDTLIALGEEMGDKEWVFAGHDYRLYSFWMLADRVGVEVEMESLSALSDSLRQPAQGWLAGTARATFALMEGRFEEAEDLISETLALGQGAQGWNAVVSQRVGLFVLRRAQGRLGEIEATIRRSVHEYPALFRFRCALAHLLAELGRERDARAALDDLLCRDLGHEHLDAEWLFSMSLLPEVCVFLGDESAAAKLYSLLLPYSGLYAHAPVEASFGSLARGLGALATTLRRFDDAENHFDAAIEIERRMGARPWLAHARHDLAAMLLVRRGAGDRERAGSLLDEAVGGYRELGMDTWAARAAAAACGG